MNRKKAILKPIPVSDSDRQFLDAILASSKSAMTKHLAVRKIVGRYCSSCGAIASQKAIFDAHGATVIKKYCDNCVKEMKFRA